MIPWNRSALAIPSPIPPTLTPGMIQVLLIFSLQETDMMSALGQCLADAHHTAVTEYAEKIVHELGLTAIQFHILVVKEADKRLSHCQPYCFISHLAASVYLSPQYLASFSITQRCSLRNTGYSGFL